MKGFPRRLRSMSMPKSRGENRAGPLDGVYGAAEESSAANPEGQQGRGDAPPGKPSRHANDGRPAGLVSRRRVKKLRRSRKTSKRHQTRMVATDPHCRLCRVKIVDVRRLKKNIRATVLAIDDQGDVVWEINGRRHQARIATVHHFVPLALWTKPGTPHAPNNLTVLCPDCHAAIDREAFAESCAHGSDRRVADAKVLQLG